MNSLRVFFFQAEDGIRHQPRSRGFGEVYKKQGHSLLQDTTMEQGNI